ncbi:MAG: HAMP domain-containing protein, partial [Terriglobales bacterium]
MSSPLSSNVPVPPAVPLPPAPRRRGLPGSPRARRVVGMGLALLVVVVLLFWPQAFNLHFQPSPAHTWLLFVISALSFLATVILALVLVRQIVKLGAERRANVLGSHFKTKLVIGALALSLTPVICMFGFTYGLINRTLDKWFSQPVVTVRDDNQQTLAMLTRFVRANAQSAASALAASPALQAAVPAGDWQGVAAALSNHRLTLQGGFAAVRDAHGRLLESFQLPSGYVATAAMPRRNQVEWQGHGYMLAEAPLAQGATVEVGLPIPAAITAQIAQLGRDRDRYDRLALERKSLRLLYTGYLLLLTLAVLFGATWMALLLSRQVTVPVAALAAATQEISRGNLGYRVRGSAGAKDEIGQLVDSFNRMAAELETNRSQIEASRHELEERRRYTEALLENTPSAVLSLDRNLHVERVNPAVARMFAQPAPQRLEELFEGSSLRAIHHLLRKASRWRSASGQIEAAGRGRALTLAATAAAIPAAG